MTNKQVNGKKWNKAVIAKLIEKIHGQMICVPMWKGQMDQKDGIAKTRYLFQELFEIEIFYPKCIHVFYTTLRFEAEWNLEIISRKKNSKERPHTKHGNVTLLCHVNGQ